MTDGSDTNVERETDERSTAPSGWSRLLPILHWSRHYDRSWLRADLLAGLTVAALVTYAAAVVVLRVTVFLFVETSGATVIYG